VANGSQTTRLFSLTSASLRPRSLATPRGVLLAGLLAMLVLGVVTLRSGQTWGDDFALYIAHAINIAEGRSYHATGYIYNPDAEIGPPAYPPLTALVLAPVYAVAGLDLEAMKTVLHLIFLAALVGVYLVLRTRAGPWTATILTLAVGFNPYVWQFREEVLSEFLFMLFFYAALWLLILPREPGWSKRRAGRLALQAVAVYLAFATRSIGIVLLPAMIAHDVLQRRRLSADTVVTVAGFALLWGLQGTLLRGTASYGDLLANIDPAQIAFNAALYAYMMWAFLLGFFDFGGATKVLVGGLFALAAAAGFVLRLLGHPSPGRLRLDLRNVGLIEIVVVGYLVMIIIPPFHQAPRYTLPLLPLLLWYAYVSATWALRPLLASAGRRAAVVAVVVALFYASAHARIERGPIAPGPTTPESVEMFTFMREQTPADAVVLFAKPRAMALFGERPTAIWPDGADPASVWCYGAAIGASHIVAPAEAAGLEVPPFLTPAALAESDQVRPVFTNPHFTVFEIADQGGDTAAPRTC
jgi:hypothetical protein